MSENQADSAMYAAIQSAVEAQRQGLGPLVIINAAVEIINAAKAASDALESSDRPWLDGYKSK